MGCERLCADCARVEASDGVAIRPQWDVDGGARVEASEGAAIRPQWDVNGGARIARGLRPARAQLYALDGM